MKRKKKSSNLLVWLCVCIVVLLFVKAYIKPTYELPKEDVIVNQVDYNYLVLLENKYDTIMFNTATNTALWCKWVVSKERLNKQIADRKNFPFIADDTPLLREENKVTTNDYNNSGYDRGHLAPACDMRFCEDAMNECMEMTNIAPQTKELNRGVWSVLEDKCRQWGKKYGKVYVVCGPIYTNPNYTYIGKKHKVAVPQKYFKVVMTNKKDKEKAIGFIIDNNDNTQVELQDCVVSVDSVENLINADFFEWLPNNIENRIERNANLNEW